MSSEFTDFELDYNLTNVQEFAGGGGPQLPPGDYIFRIQSVAQGTSKSGQPVLKFGFQVEDEASPHNGVKMQRSYSLQPQAIGRLKNLMIAIGAPLDKVRASAFMGAVFIGEVSATEIPGKVRPDGTFSEPTPGIDIGNERMLEGAIAVEEPPPPPPPPAAKKATNGATRRA